MNPLDHPFVTPALRDEALTHSSWAHEHPGQPHNERLEFLGDSVLNALTTVLLVERWPKAREGELSRLRARLVNAETLAEIAVEIGLGAHLRLGRGEERSGGRSRPSVLEDAVEALIGALFLDAGFGPCDKVVRSWMEPRMAKLANESGSWKDARSALQEHCQRRWGALPNFKVVECAGPAHAPTFRVEVEAMGIVLGEGQGPSKRTAIHHAAARALAQLTPEEP